MFEEYLQADGNEDDTAYEGHVPMEAFAKEHANAVAAQGEDEASEGDDTDCEPDDIGCRNEDDTRCEGIDTGCDSQKYELREGEGVFFIFVRGVIFGFLFLQALHDHLSTDKGQEDECDPMVVSANPLGEANAEEVSDERHTTLEEAKEKGHQKHLIIPLAFLNTSGDRYC